MGKKWLVSTKHSIILILIIVITMIILLFVFFSGEFFRTDKSLLSKVDLNLRIENVEIINETHVKVFVKCNKAEENLIGMRLVLETLDNSETVDINYALKQDETAEFTISLEKINSDNLASVKIYPIMELEDGELSIGSIKDQYTRFYT